MTFRLYFSGTKPKMAIFVSKMSHCLYDMLARYTAGEWNVEIPLIISNHPELEHIGRRFDIPFYVFPINKENKEEQERAEMEPAGQTSGQLHRAGALHADHFERMIEAFPNRIINIHHSFLPAFIGAKPYHAAFERGVKIIGATSHYVTTELDAGPIIEQEIVRITHKDTIADLVNKGKDLEKIVLSRAVQKHIERKVLVYKKKPLYSTDRFRPTKSGASFRYAAFYRLLFELFPVEYVDLQFGIGTGRFFARFLDGFAPRQQHRHAPAPIDFGFAENTHLGVRFRQHVFEVRKLHPVAVSLDYDGTGSRRTVKRDIRHGQPQDSPYMQRKLGEILRNHRYYSRIVRPGRYFAEDHPVALHEKFHAEKTPSAQCVGNPAGDLFGLLPYGGRHRLRLPRLGSRRPVDSARSAREKKFPAMAHRQQRNLVIELYESLDDHFPGSRPAALLRIAPTAIDILFAADDALPVSGRTHDRLDHARKADLADSLRELSRVAAKRYGEVGNRRVSAASRRIPPGSIVSIAARAVGTTR